MHIRFLLCFLSIMIFHAKSQPRTIAQWNFIDYAWKSNQEKQQATSQGLYNYSKIIPMDLDVDQSSE